LASGAASSRKSTISTFPPAHELSNFCPPPHPLSPPPAARSRPPPPRDDKPVTGRPDGSARMPRFHATAWVSKPTTPVAPDPIRVWRILMPPRAGPWRQDTPPRPPVKRARQTSQPGQGSGAEA
jgi:hypothetical protein